MSEQTIERSIVIAVFKERSNIQKAITKDGVVAANIETFADETIIVTKNTDGSLTINRSEHSIARTLTTLTAKLMIVLPAGLHGVLAITVAGL